MEMRFFCEGCNERSDGGQWSFDAIWLTAEQTRKEGRGIETRRYCLKCGGRVRNCFNILARVGVEAKNELLHVQNFGCDRCYVRFRCYTQ